MTARQRGNKGDCNGVMAEIIGNINTAVPYSSTAVTAVTTGEQESSRGGTSRAAERQRSREGEVAEEQK
jgi:hypothetical protein